MTDPKGRVALVTGSAKRLGRHLALRLGAMGAQVAVHYRGSASEAGHTVAELRAMGVEAEAFQADLLDPAACEALVRAVVARFGALHVLVNNVGDFEPRPILDHPVDVWHEQIGSSLHTCFHMCHFALPELRKHDYARIVNLGFAGIGRQAASPAYTPYVIAKQGVLTLTKSIAAAAVGEPLTANMISPGTLEESVSYPPMSEVPKRRWGKPEELAGAMAYLLGREADYVTGQHIEVAGGWAL